MPAFTSSREKQLWLYAFIVFVVIYSTLLLGSPLLDLLGDQNIQGVIFLSCMLLIGGAILVHGLKTKPGKTEFAIWLGFAGVYLLLFLRLGLTERTHLLEYSVLAIFIHKALIERFGKGKQIAMTALLAFAATATIGLLDEAIQMFLPDRVFDPEDIVFNSMAAFMATGGSMVLQWVRKKYSKKKNR